MLQLFGDWVDDLKFFQLHDTMKGSKPIAHPELQQMPIVLARAGWSPEDGFELYLCDHTCGERLWELIMQAGLKYNITPGSPNQSRRLEGGMLSYRNDISTDMNALEVITSITWGVLRVSGVV